MMLATHGTVGAGIVALAPINPGLALIFAFLSHFLLDAVSHCDYRILSLDKPVRPSIPAASGRDIRGRHRGWFFGRRSGSPPAIGCAFRQWRAGAAPYHLASHPLGTCLPVGREHGVFSATNKKNHDNGAMVRMNFGREFVLDMGRIGSDGLVGLLLAFLIFYLSEREMTMVFVLAGALLGMLPDFLQFVYGRIGTRPLALFQSVHEFCHCHPKQAVRTAFDLLPQAVLIIVVVGVVYYLSALLAS